MHSTIESRRRDLYTLPANPNPVEFMQAFVVAFTMRTRGGKSLHLNLVPVVLLGREEQPSREELLRAGWEGLEAGWGGEREPLSSWEVLDSVISPVAREWVVGSGPVNKTEYVVPSRN